MRLHTILLVALMSLAFTTHGLRAQAPAATNGTATNGTATDNKATEMAHVLVPRDAVACLTVRVQQIKLDQALSMLPWEMASAGSLDQLGIDLSSIERVDWIVGSLGNQFRAAAVLTSNDKLDKFKLNNKMFAFEGSGQSLRVIGMRGLENLIITPLNDNQVSLSVVGTPVPFENAEPVDGPVLKQMKRLGERGHITLVCSPEPVRQMLRQSIDGMAPELRDDTSVLIEKVQLVAARAQVDVNPIINVLIETETEADAEAVEASWNKLVSRVAMLEFGRTPFFVDSQSVVDAMKAYMARTTSEVVTLLKPTRKGNRLLLTLDQRAINLARGLATYFNLIPAFRAASRSGAPSGSERLAPRSGTPGRGTPGRGTAGRPAPARSAMLTDENKLKMLGLAAHNFEDTFRTLPTGGEVSYEDRSQLSWRVRILPFLGDPELTKLFQQFKLDEPWDSPNNIKLLEKMPDIYRYSKADVSPGYTVFQIPHGPGLISEDRKKIPFGEIQDGLGRTVLIALSIDQAAVPWTRPLDFNPNENFNLVRKDNEAYTFLLADGSVFGFPGITEPDEIKAFFTRAGND